MKTFITGLVIAALALTAGCVAVPTRHGLVLAPILPPVRVGVGVGYGYGYGYGYGPGYRYYR
jgi:Keratin-associated matrix